MATVLITGGTGLIGTSITKKLVSKGHEVIILTRDKSKYTNTGSVSYAEWDLEKKSVERSAIEKADHIINLAGAGVADKRWTEKRKKEIRDSRVKAGELLVKTLGEIPNKVQSVINASAIGWYGPDGQHRIERSFTESDHAYTDFLGTTCLAWQQSIEPVKALGKRLVIIRTGIVLAKEGGAFPEFVKTLQFRLATILGSGKQIVSWIHIDDLVNIYIYAVENADMKGVFNAVAPNPVSNKELILAIARARRKFFIPVKVPSFVLKTVLGEMSIEVLKSATVSGRKIVDEGYQFQFSNIESALFSLVLV
jgi:uncharacterized protein